MSMMPANFMRTLFASGGKLTLSASRSDFPRASNETGPRARAENQRTDSVPVAADSSKEAGGSSMARGTSVLLLPRLTTSRSEEHTSELQSLAYLVCRLLLEKKKKIQQQNNPQQQTTKKPT